MAFEEAFNFEARQKEEKEEEEGQGRTREPPFEDSVSSETRDEEDKGCAGGPQ
jgi:hypothetical protein